MGLLHYSPGGSCRFLQPELAFPVSQAVAWGGQGCVCVGEYVSVGQDITEKTQEPRARAWTFDPGKNSELGMCGGGWAWRPQRRKEKGLPRMQPG